MKIKYKSLDKQDYFGGKAKIYEFDNGFGASVICHNGSYGGPYIKGSKKNLWEVAVLNSAGEITYHTPITQDVVGHQTQEEVDIILNEISNLPSEDEHQQELENNLSVIIEEENAYQQKMHGTANARDMAPDEIDLDLSYSDATQGY